MLAHFLLVLWEFVYFCVVIYGFLRVKRKQASLIGILIAACIGLLYWVFYL